MPSTTSTTRTTGSRSASERSFPRPGTVFGVRSEGGGDRVLVVDDEQLIVDAVAMAFGYEGYDVAKAMTGAEALALAASWDPDLIVLDWGLPDIEGVEVGRRLRREGSKAAILFLTAKDTLEHKVEALRAGGDDYVTKPFGLEEVVARAHAILRRTKGLAPGAVLRFADLALD